jgi:type VI secretion system protein ImpC
MRSILHHPDFQELEGAWRALHFFIRGLESDAEFELYVLDLSKAELAAHMKSAEDPRATGFRDLLVEQSIGTPGGVPWAVLIGNYTFDATVEDASLLEGMASLAKECGAPFISAASSHLLGCESLHESPDSREWKGIADPSASAAFQALRRLPSAIYLGLALPRFLLRLPYGSETEPIEQFGFQEMPPTPKHGDYLWGNPSFVCALLLARAFAHDGWRFVPGAIQDIEGMPVHVTADQGEATVKPCTEVFLTLRSVEAIIQEGLMPLISIRNRDTIRLGRFQSLADPPAALAGRWGKAFDK